MKEVRAGLFIGDARDAVEVLSTDNPQQITHLLSLILDNHASVESPTSSSEMRKDLKLSFTGVNMSIARLLVPWTDTEDENILDDLEPCLNFIEEGRKKGAVLVHCLAGVSRSRCDCIPYEVGACNNGKYALFLKSQHLLMTSKLKLFENMGCKIDRGCLLYKQFHVKKLGEAYDKGERLNSLCFARDPALLLDSSSNFHQIESQSEDDGSISLYRCKKCRRLVASQGNVLTHVTHSQGSQGKQFKRRGDNCYVWDKTNELVCTSIFVEPMQWMTAVHEGGVLGKLSCASCDLRLGNFNWSGQRCSCGTWVCPAFQLHKSRIDACRF